MYGTRDAAASWEDFWQECMAKLGLVKGNFTSCLLFDEKRDLATFLHGSYFWSVGYQEDLDRLYAELQKTMIITRKALLGPDTKDDKEAFILNRVIRYVIDSSEHRVEREPNIRHVNVLVHQFALDCSTAKGAVTPDVKCSASVTRGQTPLRGDMMTLYRSGTMCWEYLGPDRPEIESASKECA